MGFSFGRNKDRDTCSAAEEEIRTLRAALEAVELRVAALEAAARLPGKQPASNTADVATDTAAGQIVTSVTPPSPVAARVEPAQEAGAARLSAAQLSRLHTEAHEDEVTAVAISRGFSPAGASRRSAPASETPRFVAAGVGGRLLLRGADGRPLAPPVELPAAAEALSFSAGGRARAPKLGGHAASLHASSREQVGQAPCGSGRPCHRRWKAPSCCSRTAPFAPSD